MPLTLFDYCRFFVSFFLFIIIECITSKSHLHLRFCMIGYQIWTPQIHLTCFCNTLVHLSFKSASHKSKLVRWICGVHIWYPTWENEHRSKINFWRRSWADCSSLNMLKHTKKHVYNIVNLHIHQLLNRRIGRFKKQ